jgi:hypothetical protein
MIKLKKPAVPTIPADQVVAATLVAVAAQDVDVINMAIKTNSMLPDYQEKQRLLFGEKINSESLRHYAQLFLQAGNLTDAADFFVKLTDNSGLEKVLQQAENDGPNHRPGSRYLPRRRRYQG